MSEHSDLPDNIRRAIVDLLDTLSGMTFEQIISLLEEMLGEDMVSLLTELLEGGDDFEFLFDELEILNLEQLYDELDAYSIYDEPHEIEPYYEISYNSNHSAGEIIVEMPGLDDNSLIDWYEFDNEIFIYSMNAVDQYKIIIPLPEYFSIIEEKMVYKHGLFIIPFAIE